MSDLKIEPNTLRRVGAGLRRPENVLCFSNGDLITPQMGKGVTVLSADGAQRTVGDTAEVDGQAWIPNGLAVSPSHGLLVASMGEGGGLWALARDGVLSEVLRQVDGVPLGPTNFVLAGGQGRVWITVTTRQWPISKAFTGRDAPNVADGYLVLLDKSGARIVADGLAFANEVRVDEAAGVLYAVETFGRRISRFRIAANGDLSDRTVHSQMPVGGFADGIAFDVEGHLWATSLISNRLIRIAPDGAQTTMIADTDEAHVEKIERGLSEGTMAREDFLRPTSATLANISSVAFGGPDLKTIYLGSLSADSLVAFESPVAGAPLPHWSAPPPV